MAVGAAMQLGGKAACSPALLNNLASGLKVLTGLGLQKQQGVLGCTELRHWRLTRAHCE